MEFVCPACKGVLESSANGYRCGRCKLSFPIVAGIPDFRLFPDPYIGIEEDRAKAQRLLNETEGRDFAAMLDLYYSITPEVPPALAARWTAHAKQEPAIARELLAIAGWTGRKGRLLDLGCSSGGLLVAAADRASQAAGVDVALRWLVIGSIRLRDAGIEANFVCANAEALPFRNASFDVVTATDLVEHLRDAGKGLSECRRVLTPGGATLWTSNNRYSLACEPHTGLWGVGLLPRRMQEGYVSLRRPDMHRYRVRLRGPTELNRMFRAAGFSGVSVETGPLIAPHWRRWKPLLDAYNALRGRWPVSALTKWLGPRLWVKAEVDARAEPE